MTYRDAHAYRDLPLCDSHIHPADLRPLPDSYATLRDLIAWFDYRRVTLCCLTDTLEVIDPLANLKALYLKDALNAHLGEGRVFVYGHPFHRLDGRDSAAGYRAQIEQMMACGVDGIKLLDGKPACRKRIGRPLCDPVYDEMYALIEAAGLPVKLHLGDPDFFWGGDSLMANYAKKRGWWYGDGDWLPLEKLRAEVDAILEKFPKIKLCLAHFYFMSEEPDRLRALFARHENLAVDLTPGGEMFIGMTAHHSAYRAFFADFADRIYFGTDTYNSPVPGEGLARYDAAGGSRHHLVRRMLEGDPADEFTAAILGSTATLRPLGLDDGTLRRIYFDNHRALHPSVRPLDRAAIRTALEAVDPSEIDPAYAAMEGENLRLMREYFA